MEINWVDVTSSNISQIAHDEETKVFSVKFTNGGVYSYNDVDRDIFETIQTVPSVGRYFNMMIKAYHDHTKWSSEADLAEHIEQRRSA